MNAEFWSGKRVFLTGHTGFKGSWLSLWLQKLGAEVTGYALNPPTSPSLFQIANVAKNMQSIIGDIRDLPSLTRAVQQARPDVVIHMAAQPLVRYSYREPVETYATNVMGTVNVFEAVRGCASAKVVVNVTTDKCYENKEWPWAYRENEPLGGRDPYSSSKSCSELVTSAYRDSFFRSAGVAVASARAGNVIGGGDWAEDRLIPDILRAFTNREPVQVRNPDAIRPWQHVLEPLSGYLRLAERLYQHGPEFEQAWNFGPNEEDARSVKWIVEKMGEVWGNGASWQLQKGDHPHESTYLKLDISKARQRLEWSPRWTLGTALDKVVYWHQSWLNKLNMTEISFQQISSFENTR
jgi:CDP-glucose 4,6-dehydratase